MAQCLPPKHEDLSWAPRIHVKSQTWWYALVITTLGRQIWEDPCGLLASQSSLITKPTVLELDPPFLKQTIAKETR